MDSRIKLMNEILCGVKVLKFYAWELVFLRRVGLLRDGELDALKKSQVLHSVSLASFNSSSFLVRATCTITLYFLFISNIGAKNMFDKIRIRLPLFIGKKYIMSLTC